MKTIESYITEKLHLNKGNLKNLDKNFKINKGDVMYNIQLLKKYSDNRDMGLIDIKIYSARPFECMEIDDNEIKFVCNNVGDIANYKYFINHNKILQEQRVFDFDTIKGLSIFVNKRKYLYFIQELIDNIAYNSDHQKYSKHNIKNLITEYFDFKVDKCPDFDFDNSQIDIIIEDKKTKNTKLVKNRKQLTDLINEEN